MGHITSDWKRNSMACHGLAFLHGSDLSGSCLSGYESICSRNCPVRTRTSVVWGLGAKDPRLPASHHKFTLFSHSVDAALTTRTQSRKISCWSAWKRLMSSGACQVIVSLSERKRRMVSATAS